MKVGILSMQRIANYGSILQAYSLKATIESLGHEVQFVDYTVESAIVKPKISVAQKIYQLLRPIVRKMIFGKRPVAQISRPYGFDDYVKILGLSEEPNIRPQVDVLIIGSDEVFNCLQENEDVGYSLELFGKNNQAKKLISYAASFGHTTINELQKYSVEEEIGALLTQFGAVSVRDNNSFEIVKALSDKNSVIHVDPVFIYDYEAHIPTYINCTNYILIYSYPTRLVEFEKIRAIQDFAKKYHLKTLSVGAHQKWTDIKVEADPFELLAYVKGASYIITDTFHGSVFSIKYNKQFATIVREDNKNKLDDLLQRFSLKSQEYTDSALLENILLRKINYRDINMFIAEQSARAITYLKDNIT